MNYKIMGVILMALSACSTPKQLERTATTLVLEDKTEKLTLAPTARTTNLLPGAEKVTLKAMQELSNAEHCSKVLDMELKARTSYNRALNETKNRAYLSGANAMAITSWSELPNSMIMKSSLYKCSAQKS